jgi:hypothetical protein
MLNNIKPCLRTPILKPMHPTPTRSQLISQPLKQKLPVSKTKSHPSAIHLLHEPAISPELSNQRETTSNKSKRIVYFLEQLFERENQL